MCVLLLDIVMDVFFIGVIC